MDDTRRTNPVRSPFRTTRTTGSQINELTTVVILNHDPRSRCGTAVQDRGQSPSRSTSLRKGTPKVAGSIPAGPTLLLMVARCFRTVHNPRSKAVSCLHPPAYGIVLSPASMKNSYENSYAAAIWPTRPTCCSSDRPVSESRPRRQMGSPPCGSSPARRAHNRRTRLPTNAITIRGCSVPGHLPPLPARIGHPDHQPQRRVLGRHLLRHHHRRCHVDRLLHRSVVFTITGDNYRLRSYQAHARKHRPKGDRH